MKINHHGSQGTYHFNAQLVKDKVCFPNYICMHACMHPFKTCIQLLTDDKRKYHSKELIKILEAAPLEMFKIET